MGSIKFLFFLQTLIEKQERDDRNHALEFTQLNFESANAKMGQCEAHGGERADTTIEDVQILSAENSCKNQLGFLHKKARLYRKI